MRRYSPKKGMAMAMVLFIIVIVMILAMSIAFVGAQNLNVVRRDSENVAAYYAASAGLELGMKKIREDNLWLGTEPGGSQTYLNVPMPNDANVTYSVRVYNNLKEVTCGANPMTTNEEGVVIPKDSAWVVAEGRYGNPANPRVRKKVCALLRKGSVFDYALFAKESLAFNGNITVDSYNSLNGPYATSQVPGEADVGTNGFTVGSITFHGNSNEVDGDVAAGPGSTTATFVVKPSSWTPNGVFDILTEPNAIPNVVIPAVINGSPIGPALDPTPYAIPGKKGALLSAGEMIAFVDYRYHFNFTSRKKPDDPPAPEPDGILPPGHYQAITVANNGTYILQGNGSSTDPAVYVFEGINLTGGAILEVDNTQGPVIVYVNGPVNLQGSSGVQGNLHHHTGNVNASPLDLRIYATAACDILNFHGNPECYAAIYAPQSHVWLHGNVAVNGAIVGQTIQVNGNPDVHYDIALRQLTDIPILKVDSYQRF
jgi:hypothetical protein